MAMLRRRKTDRLPGEGGPEDLEMYRRAWHSYVARRNLVVVLFASFLFLGLLIDKLKLGERQGLRDSAGLGWSLSGGSLVADGMEVPALREGIRTPVVDAALHQLRFEQG